ncbi:MAG TPA: hydantoinase B/oxoprolinase family protein [Gammaproteobacteria bacterium]|nr:hydantoinase B/oxoprolinase family protein [Gammaproteobacteria bacterium]
MNTIELSLFAHRIAALCDEMGAVLRRAAFSPNIRDRLDFSCAVFDAEGGLCGQAAHIPVHLGSMAYAMRDIVGRLQWAPGDMAVFNDPFLGGTHLPDVTVVAPVFHDGRCAAFVANRAHHADIGGKTPGSMPIARRLEEEGVVIPPTILVRDGRLDEGMLRSMLEGTCSPERVHGDFAAQVSANRTGAERLASLIGRLGGVSAFTAAVHALNDYAERLAWSGLATIPRGRYAFEDLMDDDGLGRLDLPVRVCIDVRSDGIEVDFSGTAAQVEGNINCPLPVTAAAVLYAFRCLMPSETPACAGAFRGVRLRAPEGSLVNACRPAAVAAGNVETSSRIVDAVLGALAQALPDRIPAASQGTMNNLAMGARLTNGAWDYYETIAGGTGAHAHGPGLSGVQSHMTNTLNTPIEVLEANFPVRVRRYALRDGSGGAGLHRGGDGLVRAFEFLGPAEVTLLTERRRHAPWGLAGGESGAPGRNLLNGEALPGKVACRVAAGDVLTIETPGGGGWGRAVK